MNHRHHLILIGLSLAACTLNLPGDDTITTTSSSTTSATTTVGQSETGAVDPGVPTTTTLTPTTEAPDPSTTGTGGAPDDSSGTDSGFIFGPDFGANGLLCDPFMQDCPAPQKCTWWNQGDGSGQLSSTRCVDVVADPVEVGAPCHAEGDGFTGLDDCERGAMCWPLDENQDGTCIALCGGTQQEPTCAPGSACPLHADGIGLCLDLCDPLAQDCPAGDVCLPDGDDFFCVIDLSGDAGQAHDPCEFANVCDPGLLCMPSSSAVECDPAVAGCCQPLCDLDLPNTCPGAGQVCAPLLDPPPPELADVGVCTVPP